MDPSSVNLQLYKPEIITIDGESASGKGTQVAGLLELLPDYKLIDAGSMYRALTQMCLYHNISIEDLTKDKSILKEIQAKNTFDFTAAGNLIINGINVDMSSLKTPDIDGFVSKVSGVDTVKKYIVREQKSIVKNGSDFGWILDGRCMGSAVAPQAAIKFYTHAPLDVRAGWRHAQYVKNGITNISIKEVKEKLRIRDREDLEAKVYPLVKPEDSIDIKTSDYSIEEGKRKVQTAVMSYFLTHGKLKAV